MSEWKLIEDLPSDAGAVLGYDPKLDEIAIFERLSGGMFCVVHDREGDAWSDYAPTHWMPLPDPPTNNK